MGRRGPRRRYAPGAPHPYRLEGRPPRLHGTEDRQEPPEREAHTDDAGGAQEALGAPARRDRPRAGSLWRENGLIFATETGTPLNRQNLGRRSFKPLLKLAGLPEKTRFHDLRHTCATLLLVKGIHPKVVQELLGHSNIAITLDTYSHVLPGMGDEAADAMENALK